MSIENTKLHSRVGLLTLTVVGTGQRVFHGVIQQYLTRITFGDQWASELVVPVTERPLLRIRPSVAEGDPIFLRGGPVSAVHSRARAGGDRWTSAAARLPS